MSEDMRKTGHAWLGLLVVASAVFLFGSAHKAAAHGSTRTSVAESSFTRSLPSSLRHAARWMTVGGRRVWGVPLTLQLEHGHLTARAAAIATHNNLGSGLCMSSYPNAQGQPIEQFPCTGSLNQQWTFYQGTNNQGYLGAMGSPGGALCLNNYGGRFVDNNAQALWACSSNSYAMWYGVGTSNFSGYLLVHLNQAVGLWSSMCLTSLGNTASGSHIDEYTCNRAAANQSFGGNWTQAVGGP